MTRCHAKGHALLSNTDPSEQCHCHVSRLVFRPMSLSPGRDSLTPGFKSLRASRATSQWVQELSRIATSAAKRYNRSFL